jgi:hypothetical protein
MSALVLSAGCSSGSGDPPEAPRGLQAVHDSVAVRLTWNGLPPSDVDSYEVEGRVSTAAFELVDVLPGTEASDLVDSDPTLPDGTPLSFRVRAVKDGKPSAYSNEASIASIKRFSVLSALPEPGVFVVPDGFAADFAFNNEIDPASANAGSMTFLDSARKPLPTTVEVGKGGKSVHLVLEVPLASVSEVSATVQARSQNGQTASISAGPWSAPTASVFQHQELSILPTNGAIRLDLPDPIALVQPQHAVLLAGSIPIADLGSPPWGPVVWDTSTVPEGLYPLSIRIPGFFPNDTWTQGPQVLVDRTPPHVTCAPESGQPDQVGLIETIRVLFDEDLFDAAPVLLVDGVAHPTRAFPQSFVETDLFWDVALPKAPFVGSVSLGPNARDAAGNRAILTCKFQVPTWLRRWGPSLASADGPVLASSVALDPRAPAPNGVFVGWVPPSGTQGEGRLFAATFSPAATATPVAVSTPGAVVSSVSLASGTLAWTESVASGPGSVMVAQFQASAWVVDPASPLNFDRTRDANHVAAAQTDNGTFSAGRALVWSEDDSNGGRILRGSQFTFPSWVPLTLDVGATPAGIADFPSFTANFPAIGPSFSAFVSFLDTPPGGLPQMRTSNGNLGSVPKFVPGVGPLNADPSSAASDPSGFAFGGAVVAWVEGGKVYARTAEFDFGIFSSAVVLNSDPARAARSPRVANRNTVVFVEAGPNGDEIRAKRWDAGAWNDLGVLNPGATGAVTALAVAPGPFVAWADGGGAVHLLQGNF